MSWAKIVLRHYTIFNTGKMSYLNARYTNVASIRHEIVSVYEDNVRYVRTTCDKIRFSTLKGKNSH